MPGGKRGRVVRVRWDDFSKGLNISGPADAGPENGLRLARDVAALIGRSVKCAPPTNSIFSASGNGTGTIHSLAYFTSTILFGRGTDLRRQGTTTAIRTGLNGNPLWFAKMPPTPGKQDWLFVAGGGALFKVSSSMASAQWGIDAPSGATFSAIAQSQLSLTIDALGSAASFTPSACSLHDDAAVAIDGSSIRMNGIPKNDEASMTKSTTLDLSTYGASESPDEDFITFYFRANRPKHVTSIEVAFAVGDTSFNNAYIREVLVETVKKKRRRKLIGVGDLIRIKDQANFLQENVGKLKDLSLQESLGQARIAVAKRAWSRVTLPKTTFESSGLAGSAGFTWENVTAIRFTVETNNLGTTDCWFDLCELRGGVGMLGDYEYTVTFKNSVTGHRSNPPMTDEDGDGIEDTVSTVKLADLERQGASLSNLPTSSDPQVDTVEIWRTMGNGGVLFKCGEVAEGTTTFSDSVADYVGLFGNTQSVLEPEVLPLDNFRPDSTLLRVVGPHYGRLFWIGRSDAGTAEKNRLYFSGLGRPEAMSSYIEVGSADDPLTSGCVWNNSLYVWSRSKMYVILGSDEPFVAHPITGAPGTSAPRSVCPTPVGIFWVARDGLYLFNGGGVDNVSDAAVRPIFHSELATEMTSADDFGTIDSSADVNCCYARNELWIMATSIGAALVLNVETGVWRMRDASSIGTPILYVSETDQIISVVATSSIVDLEREPFNTSTAFPNSFTFRTMSRTLDRGRVCVVQRVYIDYRLAASETLTPAIRADETETNLTALPVSSSRTVVERAVNVACRRLAIKVVSTAGALNNPFEIFAVEADVWVPDAEPSA